MWRIESTALLASAGLPQLKALFYSLIHMLKSFCLQVGVLMPVGSVITL